MARVVYITTIVLEMKHNREPGSQITNNDPQSSQLYLSFPAVASFTNMV